MTAQTIRDVIIKVAIETVNAELKPPDTRDSRDAVSELGRHARKTFDESATAFAQSLRTETASASREAEALLDRINQQIEAARAAPLETPAAVHAPEASESMTRAEREIEELHQQFRDLRRDLDNPPEIEVRTDALLEAQLHVSDLNKEIDHVARETGRSFSRMAGGTLQFARGLAFVGLSTEEESRRIIRGVLAVQGVFDGLRGGYKALKGLENGLAGVARLTELSTARTEAMNVANTRRIALETAATTAATANGTANTAVAVSATAAAAGENAMATASGTAAASSASAAAAGTAQAGANAAVASSSLLLNPITIALAASVGTLAAGYLYLRKNTERIVDDFVRQREAILSVRGAYADANRIWTESENSIARQVFSIDRQVRALRTSGDELEDLKNKEQTIAEARRDALKSLSDIDRPESLDISAQLSAAAQARKDLIAEQQPLEEMRRFDIASPIDHIRSLNVAYRDLLTTRGNIEQATLGRDADQEHLIAVTGISKELEHQLATQETYRNHLEETATITREAISATERRAEAEDRLLDSKLKQLDAVEKILDTENRAQEARELAAGNLDPRQQAQLERLRNKVDSKGIESLNRRELDFLQRSGFDFVKEAAQDEARRRGRESGIERRLAATFDPRGERFESRNEAEKTRRNLQDEFGGESGNVRAGIERQRAQIDAEKDKTIAELTGDLQALLTDMRGIVQVIGGNRREVALLKNQIQEIQEGLQKR